MDETQGPKAAFLDFPKEAYPLTIEVIAERTGEVVHTVVVEGPGACMMPGLREQYGPIAVRVTYGDGTATYTDSRGNSRAV